MKHFVKHLKNFVLAFTKRVLRKQFFLLADEEYVNGW